KHKGCYDRLFRKKVKYHVLSYKMKQKLMTNDILDENIQVITPAIDINLFKPAIEIIPKNDIINIVCVSRLHWVKGLNYALEAMSLLKKEGIQFKFTIIGSGEEQERLVFAAYQLGIIDDVVFTGKLTQEEIIFHLNQADLYVQYSIQEGFGNAVLEAQALGVFCIVSDADGLQENVLHEKTGLIVPKRNPIALVNAIKTTRDFDAKKIESINNFAIERAKKDFNLERQNKAFGNFYNKR
ncbi:glycosyltransferase family 4 protein, partial [Oceanihabitans sp.]|nr:glycosyltransferase family 4 protein [Oceanihabitans sp.]